MRLSINTKTLLLFNFAALSLASCSDVADDDRYIDLPVVEVQRSVLVEDFTGQACVNCPTAHEYIHSLEEQYGDAVIAVSIHAGVQSVPYDSEVRKGLATPVGEIYDAEGGIAPHGYPSIVVDYDFSSVYVGTATEWIDAVRTAMAQPSPIRLEATASMNADSSSIEISVSALCSTEWTGVLQMWIVEDSIVAPQRGVDGRSAWTQEYVHSNVLRAAANGTYGQQITLTPNHTGTFTCNYPITTDWERTWVPANLRIVAFCRDTTGVIQTTRTKVTN